MKALKIILIGLSFGLFITSCKKEDPLGSVENIPGLGGDTWAPGAIDKWIYDSLTAPYNIAVKYKWDQFELSLNRTLVPPKEEKVIPALSSIAKGWINPYVKEAGLPFFKNVSPKFFDLVGSASYNSDGSITLGTAEGGRKVVLYVLNNFRIKGMPGYTLSDTSTVIEMFHTIQHEYAHILDQNVKIPTEFSQSSASAYTSDWTNVNPQEALYDGFISQYSISQKGEDWAEMVSLMLVKGRPWFENLVNSINYTGTTPNGTTAAVAKARLRQKESAVVSYFKQAWNIDFYSLQTRVKTAINALLY
ncbi:MAG: putative zinc-binding metallopeptidase [Rhizobacter sp.]|nr:putative zinc-binding metallopeptidase [Ferruginibacter sp.]